MPQPAFADSGFRIRKFEQADIPAALALSRSFQWPHSAQDWERLLSYGAGVVGMLDDNVVGTILHWTYGSGHASLGLVLVDSTRQGTGLGGKLLSRTFELLGNRSIRLCATEAGRPLYEKRGFVAFDAITQMQGICSYTVPSDAAQGQIRTAEPGDIDQIALLDEAAFGYDRRTLLLQLISDGRAAVMESNSRLAGFSVFRPFGRGYAIGPVVASSEAMAISLTQHWTNQNIGKFVRVDALHARALAQWLPVAGLNAAPAIPLMVKGSLTPELAQSAFAISNQALC
jgi:predicted N-acetyltransferase YhbS